MLIAWFKGKNTFTVQQILEKAYQDFHHESFREKDPVRFLRRYKDPLDQEVVGLFSAILAYGNVNSILKSVEKVLALLGPHPAQIIREGKFPDFSEFYHRFTIGDDLEILCHWLHGAYRKAGSFQNYFLMEATASCDMKAMLSRTIDRLWSEPLPARLKTAFEIRERNLKYLLPNPKRGSACKRLNLYLRWMVRKEDGIDIGIWDKVNPALLILPIDTHILKAIHALKWSTAKNANWKLAEEITGVLKTFDQNDPIRYDFALCHLSMEGHSISWEETGTTILLPKKPAKKTSRRDPSTNSKR